AATRRRVVALVAADVAGGELELRVGLGPPGHGEDAGHHQEGAESHQLFCAPSRIQRSMSSMSGSASGRSGGMRCQTPSPRSMKMSLESSGRPGFTRWPSTRYVQTASVLSKRMP